MKKIWGRILYGVAKSIDVVLGGLISLLSFLVDTVEKVRSFVIGILTLGCLFFMMTPFLWLSLMDKPIVLISLLVILVFPIIGMKSINGIEHAHYVLTEYLYDKSDVYRLGKTNPKLKLADYSEKYKNIKAEEARKRAEARQKAEQEAWNKRFEDFFNSMGGMGGGFYGDFGQGSFGGQGSYGQGRYGGSSRTDNPFQNPTTEFNQKFKKSCETLGVSYNTNEEEVKQQYRKMAKKYHPDLNKEAGAKEKFQEINAAYEFLSKENIQRYKSINN